MKMTIHLLTALFLQIPVISATVADTFILSGREIVVPIPKGFVRATDEMTAVQKFSELMADPVNDTLAYYILESDVPAALAGEFPSLERTFVLKVNKKLRNMTVGQDKFSELMELMKNQNQMIFEKVKSQIPGHMKQASQGMSREFDVKFAMKITNVVPLEPHYEEANAIAYSMYINYGLEVGSNQGEMIVAGTATFLNVSGVILFLYGYAPQNDLDWTRKASSEWAESVLANNQPPPLESPSDGVGGFLTRTIIGGFIGVIIGLITTAFSRSKQKKRD